MAWSNLVPFSPFCTCLSSIDRFGDHLLGCSRGPMRIRHHDTLVSIISNALSKDHPGVLKEQALPSVYALQCLTGKEDKNRKSKEQRASYDDGLRPGDIFHPDFQHDHSA